MITCRKLGTHTARGSCPEDLIVPRALDKFLAEYLGKKWVWGVFLFPFQDLKLLNLNKKT